jgi:hypothetical protein
MSTGFLDSVFAPSMDCRRLIEDDEGALVLSSTALLPYRLMIQSNTPDLQDELTASEAAMGETCFGYGWVCCDEDSFDKSCTR